MNKLLLIIIGVALLVLLGFVLFGKERKESFARLPDSSALPVAGGTCNSFCHDSK